MGRKEKFVTFKDETAISNFKMEILYQNERKNINENYITKVAQFCCLTF